MPGTAAGVDPLQAAATRPVQVCKSKYKPYTSTSRFFTCDTECDIRNGEHRIISIVLNKYELRRDTQLDYETRPGQTETIRKAGLKYYYRQFRYDIRDKTNSILKDRLGGCANFVSLETTLKH